MGQYCDSAVIEENWFHWILSSSVPTLEPFREQGLLWTKVLGTVKRQDGIEVLKQGQPLKDPSFPIRAHCVALGRPVYIRSRHGVPQSVGTISVGRKTARVELSRIFCEASLYSSEWFHNLANPFVQQLKVIPRLIKNGYVLEKPIMVSWQAMLLDISRMCQGIAAKFKPSTEEELMDLANEALLQVTRKLVAGRLVYVPGKAPVFNLLTTTIYRCMYSIMNKGTNRRKGLNRLLEDAQAGVLPSSRRSLRVPHLIRTH